MRGNRGPNPGCGAFSLNSQNRKEPVSHHMSAAAVVNYYLVGRFFCH